MAKVISFQDKRQESIEKKKRSFERVIFKKFLGVYAEIDTAGTKYDVALVDISHNGCQFQVPNSPGAQNHFKSGSDVTLRLYFTNDDFLPVQIGVRHAVEHKAEDGKSYWRLGGEFNKELPSFAALLPFIDFLYKFAEFSCVDKGESKVYYL